MEDQESLKSSALISQFTSSVQHEINDFFSNSIMATGIIVCSILLSSDQLLWVEQLPVSASSDLVNHSRLQIHKNSSWNMLACTSLGEKGVEGVITSSNSLVTGHLTIRLNAMFQAVQFPTGIANLATCLTDMNKDTLTHC